LNLLKSFRGHVQVESVQDRKMLTALELHSNLLIQQNVSKGQEWLEMFLRHVF
jgi:hypothetical protein